MITLSNCISASDLFIQNLPGSMNNFPVSREKNALKIVLKAAHLIELGMQVLEWRITAPTNKTKCIYESKLPFFGSNLLSRYTGSGKGLELEVIESPSFFPKVRLTWTGNKIDLVELIYAWETAGCFNHGHVTIKEIVDYIEIVFNIDLNGYYRMFIDMRNRADRTAFLDKLINFLKARMDEADRKK
jgi:hypothetical protein